MIFSYLRPKKAAWAVLAFWAFAFSQAEAQCPNCTVNLPANLPGDTVYLDSFPNAQKNAYYEEQLSFRFSYTTNPLAALQPGTPSGVNLSSYTIRGINGLPAGLTWTLDRPTPAVYDEVAPDTRDGCVTICGTPLQAGTFTVNISITVETQLLGSQAATIPIEFIVMPDSAGAGFTLTPPTGCDSLWVNFTNLVSPLAGQTADYAWDFGNGQTSMLQSPDSVFYSDTGTYTVSYRAVVSTPLPRTYLSSVTVTASPCADLFGNAPDLFVTIGSDQSGNDTISAVRNNTNPPVAFNFGNDVNLQGGVLYSIFVQDDDAISNGIPGPENCGTVYFNSDTLATRVSPINFSLTQGSLTVQVTLNRDTMYLRDTTESSELVVVQYCGPPTAVAQTMDVQNLNLYPNPTQGLLNLRFDLQQNTDLRIRVLDLFGRTVHEQVAYTPAGLVQEQLNLNNLPAGMYLVEIETQSQRQVMKVRLNK